MLREAIAAVAAVDADAVTIVRVGSARRRLQADVDGIVVEYCVEIKFYGAFALKRLVDLHAIDARPAR